MMVQFEGEPFISFLRDLKWQLRCCDSEVITDSMVRYQTVLRLRGRKIRERLLREKDLSLGKAAETAGQQNQALDQEESKVDRASPTNHPTLKASGSSSSVVTVTSLTCYSSAQHTAGRATNVGSKATSQSAAGAFRLYKECTMKMKTKVLDVNICRVNSNPEWIVNVNMANRLVILK